MGGGGNSKSDSRENASLGIKSCATRGIADSPIEVGIFKNNIMRFLNFVPNASDSAIAVAALAAALPLLAGDTTLEVHRSIR